MPADAVSGAKIRRVAARRRPGEFPPSVPAVHAQEGPMPIQTRDVDFDAEPVTNLGMAGGATRQIEDLGVVDPLDTRDVIRQVEAHRLAHAQVGEVTITVTRATATQAVLAIGYVHPERGAEVVNVPLELGGAVMLAHGLLGAVCAPAPEATADMHKASDAEALRYPDWRCVECGSDFVWGKIVMQGGALRCPTCGSTDIQPAGKPTQ